MRSGLFANLREMTAHQQSSLSRLHRQWNQRFLLFFFFSRLFFFLSFFSLSVERPKLTPGRRKIRGYCREKKPRQQYSSSYGKNGLSSQRERIECMMLKLRV